jgi:hypothetical protein
MRSVIKQVGKRFWDIVDALTALIRVDVETVIIGRVPTIPRSYLGWEVFRKPL